MPAITFDSWLVSLRGELRAAVLLSCHWLLLRRETLLWGAGAESRSRYSFPFSRKAAAAVLTLLVSLTAPLVAQSSDPAVGTPSTQNRPSGNAQTPAAQAQADNPPLSGASAAQTNKDQGGQQTRRILGIAPNFQAVSANTQLPPLSIKGKFWLATEGTFDYSSFISVGFQAGIEEVTHTYPEFRQGAAGYGRYYWHTFADSGIENYFTGAMLPVVTHEDPRYYTLYRGGFLHRTNYAVSRLWITKKDRGNRTFNFSEIVGSGMAAEVSSRYYPRHEREASEILERWASQVLNDGIGNVFEEFWPDIRRKLLHRH